MVEAYELLTRCRRGDQDAARLLFNSYFDRLLPLARSRIGQRLASRVDPEDIVQTVFFTFFSHLKADRFQPNNHDDLLRLLVRMTECKALKQVAHHTAYKRSPNRELSQEKNDRLSYRDVPTAEPSAEAVAAFLDQLDHFLRRLGVMDRQVLELRMQGYSTAEIAQKLNSYDRMIRRVLVRIRAVAITERFLVES